MGIFKRTRENFKRELAGEQAHEIAGKAVVCSHCGGMDFEEGTAQLNTAGLTFLSLDWLNENAIVLICKKCGHLEWFL